MEKMRLGKTGIEVSRSGFGALPIQRISPDESTRLLRKAFHNGINFFDTARYYSDSEEKLGKAFSDIRGQIVIATKSGASNKENLLKDLEVSLKNLSTDYVDILQLHNPNALPDHQDPQSSYAGLIEAQKLGMVRFIGITNHSLQIAMDAARTGLYDTVQFPLSTLSSENELQLIGECKKNDCGLIAMKALGGGLITNVSTVFAFLRQFDNVLPIWGIQHEWELEQFLTMEISPPVLDKDLWKIIEQDRIELASQFCRGCGYCMPCPEGIPISWAARMSLLLRRAPSDNFLNSEWQERMALINKCTTCGNCKNRCPYDLDTPELLRANLKDYEEFCRVNA